MHISTLESWRHSHNYLIDTGRAEKSTLRVMVMTAAMMVVEIVAGMIFGSMALLADGWHMATHVAAFGITLFVYRYARSHAENPRFTFGTGKVSVLGGFASAVALAVVALVMALESLLRLFQPEAIHFNEAIGVAVAGLLVNLVSGYMLHEHQHHDEHDHQHHGHEHGHDHNLRAAYLHVLADALTSLLAIVALTIGKIWGWIWLDPVMGLVGAAVIGRWAYGLLKDTGTMLLDGSADETTVAAIRQAIEEDADNRLTDLHVWHVGPAAYSAGLALVTHCPQHPDHYKNLLGHIPHLAHVLVEVNPCPGESCIRPKTHPEV
jgi:cation diffusion facilitator family transporter